MSCVIYTCHNVVPLAAGQQARGTVDLDKFLHQLSWLLRLGVRFIPMKSLQGWLLGKNQIPKRSAVLTFDDALVSVADHVWPHLKQQAIPFTVFVIAGLIGRESHFSTRSSAPARRHLDLSQLKMMIDTGLVEIGAHGYHHVNFTKVEGDKLHQEIHLAKDLLEECLGVTVPYLAYPWGNTTDSVTQMVKEAGYRLAFTTRKKKLVSNKIDLLRIPRVTWSRRATVFKLAKYFLIPRLRAEG